MKLILSAKEIQFILEQPEIIGPKGKTKTVQCLVTMGIYCVRNIYADQSYMLTTKGMEIRTALFKLKQQGLLS